MSTEDSSSDDWFPENVAVLGQGPGDTAFLFVRAESGQFRTVSIPFQGVSAASLVAIIGDDAFSAMTDHFEKVPQAIAAFLRRVAIVAHRHMLDPQDEIKRGIWPLGGQRVLIAGDKSFILTCTPDRLELRLVGTPLDGEDLGRLLSRIKGAQRDAQKLHGQALRGWSIPISEFVGNEESVDLHPDKYDPRPTMEELDRSIAERKTQMGL